MPKTVITGANGATTSTNAAVTDTDGKYKPTTATAAHPAAAGVYWPPKS